MYNHDAENSFPFLVKPICSRIFSPGVTVRKLIGEIDNVFLNSLMLRANTISLSQCSSLMALISPRAVLPNNG